MLNHRRHLLGACVLFACLVSARPGNAYSVLSHEEVVDMAWKDTIVPMLRARFPGIAEDDIRLAHAYAYGGSVIQDIGYYPFGSHYFSDLLHYVRPEEFVTALIRDSRTPDEYAFALGALAHYCGDTVGHPAVNSVTADENPRLKSRFGRVVTYAEDSTAHVRTEFGFDVVEVAQGHYSQQNYRDFIGFLVAKPLLEQAFQETYGLPVTSVMKHEDMAIGSYRRAVSSLIPELTKIAFVRYHDQIEQAAPGTEKNKFEYRLNQTEYEKEFGNNYQHVGVRGRIAAFFVRIVPKIGPFKALKVNLPDAQDQVVYLKSINATVDRFRLHLAEIHAAPAPLPPPDPKDARELRKSADRVAKDATAARHEAERAKDEDEKASLAASAKLAEASRAKAENAASRIEAKVAAGSVGPASAAPVQTSAIAPGSPIAAPSTPQLPHLDLDTGRPSAAGEYPLADETYARLLDELVKAGGATRTDPKVAADIEQFFAKAAPATAPLTRRELRRQAAEAQQIRDNLIKLKSEAQ